MSACTWISKHITVTFWQMQSSLVLVVHGLLCLNRWIKRCILQSKPLYITFKATVCLLTCISKVMSEFWTDELEICGDNHMWSSVSLLADCVVVIWHHYGVFVGFLFIYLFFWLCMWKGNSCIKGKFSVMFFLNFYFSLQRLVSEMSKRPVQEWFSLSLCSIVNCF